MCAIHKKTFQRTTTNRSNIRKVWTYCKRRTISKTSGASILYREVGERHDPINDECVLDDIEQVPWGTYSGPFDYTYYDCGSNPGSYRLQAKATKTGMTDSEVVQFDFSIPTEIPCFDYTDCNNWEERGYSSFEDCDCQVNGNCPETDCTDWENMGYSSYEDCDCAENGNCPEEEPVEEEPVEEEPEE